MNINSLELFQSSAPTAQDYNELLHILKTIFWEEIKSRTPLLNAVEKLKQEKMKLIEEKRLDSLLSDISNKLKSFDESKLDKKFVGTEEFARIVFNIFEKASIDYRADKLKYYSNTLVNYSTINFSGDFYKEGVIERISKYSIEHILVLSKFYDLHNNPDSRVTTPSEISKFDFYVKDILDDDTDEHIAKLCVIDLEADGFIHESIRALAGYNGGSYCITEYGVKCIEIIKG